MIPNRSLRASMFSILVCLAGTQQIKSQSSIQGVIRGSDEKPFSFANVLLLKSTDSSFIGGVISDTSGRYFFKNVQNGSYLITASFTGMRPVYSQTIEMTADKKTIHVNTLYLENANGQLRDVTVIVKKPLFEQKMDRVIINVKNNISDAGGTALDILEKSPGVTVNRQSNSITMNGKNGVAIMINGKMNYMPTDAIVQLLAGMSANNIEKMELITTPPAKYDAGGNAGYINIVLIDNPFYGFNGSYFVTAGYGCRELGAAGGNFNYRTSKFSLYGDYTFIHTHYIQPSTGFTQFTRSGIVITNTSFSNRDAIRQVQNLRIGMDYLLDTATTISALISGYISHWSMIAHNGATIYKNSLADTMITSVDDPEINNWQNIQTNLSLQHVFRPGKAIFFDANYVYYRDYNPNTYSTDYYNREKELLYHEDLKSGKMTPIHFWVFSSDYNSTLSKKITMETGAKISLSAFANHVTTENLKQGIWVSDPGLSANYALKENIGSVYTSFNINTGGNISLKAGLRYEYTITHLGSSQTPDMVNRKYGELFPTFYISDKLDKNHSINFSYSRRITRPAFTDLAPFTVFFDPKTFFTGNPALSPAIANTLQVNYGFKNYNVSLSYTHEVNTIENFYFQTQRIDTSSGIVYLSPSNFKSEQYLTAGFSLPFPVTSWWSMQNNVIGTWRQLYAVFDETPVHLTIFNFSLNSTQRFSLPKDFALEITGFYSSASYFGTAKRKPLYQLDAGLQKTLGKNNILRLTTTDIFNSGSYWKIQETLPNTNATVNRSFNYGTLGYRITYTHNFGNKSLKVKKERVTGAEDELNRVHN